MERRSFLNRTAAVASGAALAGSVNLTAASAAAPPGPVPTRSGGAGPQYTANKAPLTSEPFLRLPPGSITPKGWLRAQLDLQIAGLNGRMPDVSDYLGLTTSGWSVPDKPGWEELPYWLRGFGDLGYVTGHAATLELTRTWIDRILATQQSDGFFGPTSVRTALNGGVDFWPHMPVLDALRTWQEYSGDERVVPALTSWLAFLHKQPPTLFSQGWGSARCGDTIDTAYWLYNRTGDSWLLDLVHDMHTNGADYTHSIPTWHNVNLAQGFREPAQYGVLAGDRSFKDATYRVYDTVMGRYGQFAGGGFAGDENARSGYHDPRQGFETCGIVEYMHSHQMLTRITGDSVWADRCEELAVNMLPAAFDPEQKGTHYITAPNSIQLDNVPKSHGQFDNGFAMQAYMPGIHQYRCCPHNYGMGWPYYAEEMWLASRDGGLCASLYGESAVTAKVAGGTSVTLTEHTGYPFDETVSIALSTPRSVRFPLYLRVPGWCSAPSLKVNGRGTHARRTGGYLVLERDWHHNDRVELRLPMDVRVRTWHDNRDSVSVDRGPLTYSLRIDEQWSRFAGTDDWPEYEVRPGSAWNYALDVDAAHPDRSFHVEHARATAANPFTAGSTPIRLRARGRRVPTWTADDQDVVTPLQPSPVRTSERTEVLTLVPSAAARLRVTSFPTAGTGAAATPWASCTASFSGVDEPQALVLNGPAEPTDSYDQDLPRFTWWDHTGTDEWVAYTWDEPIRASGVSVYWYDDTGHGACRVPAGWSVEYLDGSGTFRPVTGATAYGVAKDSFNEARFDTVRTTALRLAVRLRPGVSGGLLAWRVRGA